MPFLSSTSSKGSETSFMPLIYIYIYISISIYLYIYYKLIIYVGLSCVWEQSLENVTSSFFTVCDICKYTWFTLIGLNEARSIFFVTVLSFVFIDNQFLVTYLMK